MLNKKLIVGVLIVLLSISFSGIAFAGEGTFSFNATLDQMGNPIVDVNQSHSKAKVTDRKTDKSEKILVQCASNTSDQIRKYSVDYCWDLYGS